MLPSALSRAIANWDVYRSSVNVNTHKAKFFWKEQFIDFIGSHGMYLPTEVTLDMMQASFGDERLVNTVCILFVISTHFVFNRF